MGETAEKIVMIFCEKLPFMQGKALTPEISRLLDNKNVSDHHAIIPTMELAKVDSDTLPESEWNILYHVGIRLLMAPLLPIFTKRSRRYSQSGKVSKPTSDKF